ncbi:MAG TPA: hypothetical protein P5277_02335 [Candidatus Paceibacterota bacterium]|nr:hypothetical protein [Candidatus Paceibacterota bacterium]
MVLKTFNLDEEVYRKFSEFCRSNGISMSKQIEMFIQSQMSDDPKVREEYLMKLDLIRKGRFVKVDDFKKKYSVIK